MYDRDSEMMSASSKKSSLFEGDKLQWEGEIWLNAKGVDRIYDLSPFHLSRLVKTAENSGKTIRVIRIKTPTRPNSGEKFYSRSDLEEVSPRKKRERQLKEKRAGYKHKTAREVPKGLSEEAYNLLLLLIRDGLQQKDFPGYEGLALRTGLKKKTLAYHMRMLISQGYIQRKIFERGQRHEYRFLKGPRELLSLLADTKPKLLMPFEEDGR